MKHLNKSYFQLSAPFLIFAAFLAGFFGIITGAFLKITVGLLIADIILISGITFKLFGIVVSILHVLKQEKSMNYKFFWLLSLIIIPFAMLFYLYHINQLPPEYPFD